MKNTDIKKEISLHRFHRLQLRERVTNHKSQLAETASGRQHPRGPKTGLREEERPASEKQAYSSRSQKKSKKERQTFVYPTNNSHLCNRFRAIAVRKNREKPGMLRSNDNNLTN
ncbi:MAG TPA: hypothetical protein K8W02_08095 [Mediterranea massiliensis]|uniref:Uncharacterized protein n=1 Tax=Mediterranea massiliensis TaxID=1841865 RepID=A0A921HWV7_9BACT|nr:hypothetical protein [Mediterranea massiliensis]HJF92328.1 hypothetical protein [Mediterranea massiliensis]